MSLQKSKSVGTQTNGLYREVVSGYKAGFTVLKLFMYTDAPSPPENFTSHPNYASATDVEIVVNFMWSSDSSISLNHDDNSLLVHYIITIADVSGSRTTIDRLSNANFTATLEVNKTYSIMLYASRCNFTLMSDPFITNITIDKGIYSYTYNETSE